MLEDVAAAAAFGGNVDAARGVEPGHAVCLDAAVLRPKQPRSHAQDARLAGSGGPRERETLALLDRQLDVEPQVAERVPCLNVAQRRCQRRCAAP